MKIFSSASFADCSIIIYRSIFLGTLKNIISIRLPARPYRWRTCFWTGKYDLGLVFLRIARISKLDVFASFLKNALRHSQIFSHIQLKDRSRFAASSAPQFTGVPLVPSSPRSDRWLRLLPAFFSIHTPETTKLHIITGLSAIAEYPFMIFYGGGKVGKELQCVEVSIGWTW